MKKRILSLLLSLIMVLSLLPTTAWADWRDDWGFGGGSYPGITTNTVDHIDIAVAITDPTDATRTIILTQNMAETIVIKDSNGTTYAPTSYSTSDDGKGNNQIRMEGTFPVGTRTAPVTYTLTLDLTINSVKYTVSVNANYWNGSNVCPGTYKGANPKNDRTDAWKTGTTVDKQSRAGIDTEFGTPEATNKQVTITKVIAGVAETDLVAGKTFVFEISQGNTVNGTATVTTTAGETSAGAIVYLPEGSYTVTEKTRSDYEDYDFVSTTPSSGTLTVGANGGSITVTNTYEKKVTTGSLTINKVLAGDGASAAANKEFTFTVKDAAGNVVSTKTITGAGSATVDNLPVGGTYTVTESGADITGYNLTTKYNGEVGTSYGVTIGGSEAAAASIQTYGLFDCGCSCETCTCFVLYCGCKVNSCCPDCKCSGGSTEQPDQPQPDQPSTPTTPSATVTVTNTYTKEKTSVTVEKAWSDSDNKYNTRPTSITVQLLADGQSVSGKTATLTAANNWRATFSNLDKYSYSASGATEIAYSVEETSFPAGYTASVDGYKITNTLNTGDLTITKAFSSNVPAALLTGKTFTFSIKNAKNVEVATATIIGAGTATVSGLPIDQYTVAETSADDIPGFTLSALGSATATVSTTGGSATVTNNYTQNTTSINVEKKWGGDDDYTDLRPESITVQLLADGTAVSGKTLTLNAGSSWKGTFADLPTHKDGQEITYTVQEVNVSGYKSEVSGNATTGFTITNTAKWSNEDAITGAMLTIKKVDSADSTKLLSGAKFTLTDKENLSNPMEATTDASGIASFTNLQPGTYMLEEVSAPVGYKENSQVWTVVVTQNETHTSVNKLADGTFQKVYDCTVTVSKDTGNDSAVLMEPNNDGSYTITNELAPVTYEAKVNIEKIVKKTGGNVAPGKEEFVFVAYYKGAEKNELVGEARIITNGVDTYISKMGLTVPASAFNLKDGNGEITLYVSEVKGSSAGWKYDDTVYTLVMTVENYVVKNIGIKVEISVFSIPDGQGPDGDSATVKLSFTNEFSQTKTPNRPHKPSKPITSVKAGDAGVAMYAMSGLLSLGGAALFMKKRKDEE